MKEKKKLTTLYGYVYHFCVQLLPKAYSSNRIDPCSKGALNFAHLLKLSFYDKPIRFLKLKEK